MTPHRAMRSALALLALAIPACTPGSAPERPAPDPAAAVAPAAAPAAAPPVFAGEPAAAAAEGARVAAVRLSAEEAALPAPSYPWPPSAEALAAGFDSPEELAWMAVRAIDYDDKVRMHALLIDEETYLSKLWPSFEAERPANTIPAQFHWDHLEMKSLGGILDMTRENAGRGLRFRTVTYESVKDYVEFKLYRRTRVLVEDPLTGKVEELRLFGDIVEIGGKHKLLSYPS